MINKIVIHIKKKVRIRLYRLVTVIRLYRLVAENRQQKKIYELRKKKMIRVAFFVIHESVWKYDAIYHLMMRSGKFKPVIVICPFMNSGTEVMLRGMGHAFSYFTARKYEVVNTYDAHSKEWLDVRKTLKPDIVFFTNPHMLTKDQYYITNYLDKLTCYSQYSFHVSHLNEMQYDQLFHNLLWRAYYETPMHHKMAVEHSTIGAKNVRITGYPGVDGLLFPSKVVDEWKIQDKCVKRIIWAPHHTIEETGKGLLGWSCFLDYAQLMLDLLSRFEGELQICFKPHPLLRAKLEKVWSMSNVEKYYREWTNAENGMLLESGYIDCFLTSDAMIHDSGSFLAEYLCVNKPVLFTIREQSITHTLNPFGRMSMDNHYKAYNEEDVVLFIEGILHGFNDYKLSQRSEFINDYLMPYTGSTASENIFNDLLKELS